MSYVAIAHDAARLNFLPLCVADTLDELYERVGGLLGGDLGRAVDEDPVGFCVTFSGLDLDGRRDDALNERLEDWLPGQEILDCCLSPRDPSSGRLYVADYADAQRATACLREHGLDAALKE